MTQMPYRLNLGTIRLSAVTSQAHYRAFMLLSKKIGCFSNRFFTWKNGFPPNNLKYSTSIALVYHSKYGFWNFVKKSVLRSFSKHHSVMTWYPNIFDRYNFFLIIPVAVATIQNTMYTKIYEEINVLPYFTNYKGYHHFIFETVRC